MRRWVPLCAAVLAASQGCVVGKGWGLVEGCIHMPGCAIDPGGDPFETCAEDMYDFEFRPDFFSGDVHEDGSLTILVQRGGYRIGESDGLVITVPDYRWAAEHLVADPENVEDSEKLPVAPLDGIESLPVEERFKASFYLNDSCPGSLVAFNEGVGRIWFVSMYQNTDNGDARNEPTIHIAFELEFVDPWPHEDPQPDSARLSVRGEIRFDYQRGTPAQPYP